MNALFNVSDGVEKRSEETYKSTLTPPLKQKQCFLPHPSSKNNSAGVPPANANCMQVTSHKPRVVLQPTRPIEVNISSRVPRTTKVHSARAQSIPSDLSPSSQPQCSQRLEMHMGTLCMHMQQAMQCGVVLTVKHAIRT